MMAEERKSDINKIPYDAPLSIEEPSPWWVKMMARRGSKSSRLTSASVPDVDLTGKWIIISGGNHGIGREAALTFARWGANLILACRDPPSKETHPTVVVDECKVEAKKAGHVSEIEWWEIDMANLATVEAFAKRWLETDRPLDILCNNAGIGSSPGGEKIFKTTDGFEIIHQVGI
jgi:NAD(P)-dependent dehydrogenase (short-subunit alcohol dehydrogenase family)